MSRSEAIVIGAGLAGLVSAYYLKRAGYDVRIVERGADVALEASFANGGLLTPSMSDPWNAPGVHWELLRAIGRSDGPLSLYPQALGEYLGWGLRFLANSTSDRYRQTMQANFTLAALSVVEMRALRQQCGFDYNLGTRGTMKVFREAKSFETSTARSQELRAHGLEFEVLDAAGVIAVEPLLADIREAIVGGLHYPTDETGDARMFCTELARVLAERGVHLQFGQRVRRLRIENGRVRAVETDAGVLDADCVVVAAGAWSSQLVRGLHIRPVKGYSLSVDAPADVPLSIAVVDDGLHAAATPLGRTLRLAGTAEFSGWRPHLDPKRVRMLWDLLGAMSPRLAAAVDRSSAKPWCGFRPMAADGRPYIGGTGVRGLFVNAGHGHLGWTQAAGSGLLLSQIVCGETPTIDPRPYAVGR
jgi:D-amino-acid dehydrogenase